MSRPVKIAAWTAAGVPGILLVIVGALLIASNTDSGRAFIARETSDLTKGNVRIAGIHGTFPAALDLDRLELRDAQGLWLRAEHVSLRWSPSALLGHHLAVDSLHVALLHVERAPVSDTNQESKYSSIPDTDVKDLTVDTLELGKALAGEPTSLTVKASAHIRSLQDADVNLTARRIAGNGDYEVEVHFDPQSMKAMLRLREPAHGPLANLIKIPQAGALSVSANLEGPRNAEDLQLSIAVGPLRAWANGRLDLSNSAADLSYSVQAPSMSPSEELGWEKIDLQGQVHGPVAKLAAAGHLLVTALRVPGGVRLAQLDAQVTGDKGAVAVEAGIEGLQIPGSAPLLLQNSRLTLDAAIRLDDPRRPLTVTAHHPLFTLVGKAVTTGHQSGDLTLHLPDLKPFAPVIGAKLKGDAQLVAHVDYTQSLTSLTANLSSHVDGGNAAWAGLVRGGLTQLETFVELTDRDVTVRKIRLTGSAISLTGQGTAGRTGAQPVKAQFTLALPDVQRLAPTLAGNLKMSGTVVGPRKRLTADTRLTTTLSVRGSPLGTVSARVQAQGLPQSLQGTLEATGQLDGTPVQINVAVGHVKEGGYRAIIHRADWKSAHAEGDVVFGKTVTDTRGSVRVRLGNLSDFNDISGQQLAGAVNGQAAFTSQGRHSRAQLDFEAQNLVAAGITANARLHADGPLNALNVNLSADSPSVGGQSAHISATSVLDLTNKDLQLAKLAASYHNQDLRLLNPAEIQFAQGLAIQHLKLGMQQATLGINGAISPALDVQAAVRHLDAALVNAFVPNLLASGTLDADIALHGTVSAPIGKVQLQALNVKAKGAAAAGLPRADLRVDATLDGNSADLDAHLTTDNASQLALTGRVPLGAGANADLKLVGSLDLALANPILEAGGTHVTGTMAIDTTVTGTTAAPRIAGTVRLSHGSVRDYSQGFALTDINGELAGDQGVLRIEKLTARAAPGEISIQGSLGIMQPKFPVDIKVTARNAQSIASNIVTAANLDTDIHISGTALERLDVNGKVHLNRAAISIPSGLPTDVAVLDVERDGVPPPPPAAHHLVINLHVDVEAPNRVLITGRGLDAEMGGILHIRGTAEAPVVTGGFELHRGSFTLASSKLNFTNGTVTFNGSGLDQKLDPSLDFTAQTNVAEVTASVHISGFADAPKIELSSTPALPSDEILSRLLFGEPAAQLTAVQLLEIAPALASLQGGGNGPSLNPLTRIQKALGLDRLSVGSESNSNGSSSSTQTSGASVSAGRYVSSNVYVGVKQGTSGSSQIDVDVDLTKNLKLQAQLGNGTATAQGVTPDNDPGSSLGMAYQVDY